MPTHSPEILDKLQALKDSFARKLPEKVDEIRVLWQRLSTDVWD